MNLIDLYKTLRKRSASTVKHFKVDWKHDRVFLRKYSAALKDKSVSSMEFIHVSRSHGTCLWPIYRDNLDKTRPYLFGNCTPRETLKDLASIFEDSSSTIEKGAIIQHYDGKSLNTITRQDARRIFLDASRYQPKNLVA